MDKFHPFYEGIWDLKHIRNGEVIWEDSVHNDLVDEGEQNMLQVYFRNTDEPSSFYLRLAYDSIRETDTLSLIENEPSGNGYAAVAVPRSAAGFPTLEKHEGDYRVISKTCTFTASGGVIGPVNVMYLATSSDNTGKLIAAISLSVSRTLQSGDSLQATLKIKLK